MSYKYEKEQYYNDFQLIYRLVATNIRDYHQRYLELGELDYIYRQEIIPREAMLIKDIAGSNNSIDIYFSIFYYLLWNGYLSYNNSFTFSKDLEDIISQNGLSISDGKGVCLNIAAHFKDILAYLINNPTISTCLVGTKYSQASKLDHPSINKKYNDSGYRTMIETTKKEVFLPNHAENVIVTENGLYFYDPTNFHIYESQESISKSSKETPLDFRLNLLEGSFNKEPLSIDEYLDSFTKIISNNKRRQLPDKYLRELLNHGILLCKAKMKTICDYNRSMEDSFHKVRVLKPMYHQKLGTKK